MSGAYEESVLLYLVVLLKIVVVLFVKGTVARYSRLRIIRSSRAQRTPTFNDTKVQGHTVRACKGL